MAMPDLFSLAVSVTYKGKLVPLLDWQMPIPERGNLADFLAGYGRYLFSLGSKFATTIPMLRGEELSLRWSFGLESVTVPLAIVKHAEETQPHSKIYIVEWESSGRINYVVEFSVDGDEPAYFECSTERRRS